MLFMRLYALLQAVPCKGPLKILAIQIVFVFQIVPHILHIVVIVSLAHNKNVSVHKSVHYIKIF